MFNYGTQHLVQSKTLYLFPDTNVFIQCKRLHEVDWSSFSEWEQIKVVITRPVQAEIDSFKGRGNSRLGQRSRVISAQIRELLESSVGSLTLREKPLVNLVLRHDLKRLESLADELDYNERDDQLVGTAAGFKQHYPDFEVRLLTNDTGPMASARLVGLAYQIVPDNWVLQPEPDESDKKSKQLQAELEKYKQSEPRFIINADTQLLNTTTIAYHPLSDGEVQTLLERLATLYPKIQNFSATAMQLHEIQRNEIFTRITGMMKEYTAPSDEEVEEYFEAYDKWQTDCELKLHRIPKLLTAISNWPRLEINVSNQGSRPAEDALIIIEVDGPFHIMVALPGESLDDVSILKDMKPMLPSVPQTPAGKWEDVSAIGRLAATLNNLKLHSQIVDIPPLAARWNRSIEAIDPNKFYFKEGRSGAPLKRIEITCKQWRHAQQSDIFNLMLICPDTYGGQLSGRLNISVHASNLTAPSELNVPIRVVVEFGSCYSKAEKLIESRTG